MWCILVHWDHGDLEMVKKMRSGRSVTLKTMLIFLFLFYFAKCFKNISDLLLCLKKRQKTSYFETGSMLSNTLEFSSFFFKWQIALWKMTRGTGFFFCSFHSPSFLFPSSSSLNLLFPLSTAASRRWLLAAVADSRWSPAIRWRGGWGG